MPTGPTETVFAELTDFLPPSTIAYEPLEYEWDPYAEVIVFSADIGLRDLDRWYASKFAVHLREDNDYDPGQITIYFHADAKSRDVSVCLADTSVDRAIGNLTSYVASDRLKKLIETNPPLVGVVFMEDLNETVRKLEEAGEL